MSKLKKYHLFIALSFLSIFLFSINIFSTQSYKKFELTGEIINYYSVNLDKDSDEELIVIYKDIFDKTIHLGIYKYTNNKLNNIFDLPINSRYYYFFLANIESSNFKNIVLVSKNRYDYITSNKFTIHNLLNISSIYAFPYEYSFPLIQEAFDIDKDGYSEFIIKTNNKINIFKKDKNINSILYTSKAIYNFKLSVGGFSTIDTILLIIPVIKVEDINNDKINDLILIYRDKIVYFKGNTTNTFFNFKNPEIVDLNPYLEIRSGYSPFNKHILVKDFNGDGFLDILLFKFNIATILNTDKQGTTLIIFSGNKNGFNKKPDHTLFIKNISGIESKFFFIDINNDKKLDLINVGSKIFSSSFIFIITVKRSFKGEISIFTQGYNYQLSSNPLIQFSKNVALDSKNTQDSSQLNFNSYSVLDLSLLFTDILSTLKYDLNKDGVNDIIVYNFDGTFSFYLSNLNSATVYNTTPTKTVSFDKELDDIYYLNGPYNLIMNVNNNNLMIVINKTDGKIYYKFLNF